MTASDDRVAKKPQGKGTKRRMTRGKGGAETLWSPLIEQTPPRPLSFPAFRRMDALVQLLLPLCLQVTGALCCSRQGARGAAELCPGNLPSLQHGLILVLNPCFPHQNPASGALPRL